MTSKNKKSRGKGKANKPSSNADSSQQPFDDSDANAHAKPTLENTVLIGASKCIRYNVNDILGSGSNGTWVYSGLFQEEMAIAVKIIPNVNPERTDDGKIKDPKDVNDDARILRSLDHHRNIIRYYMFDKDTFVKVIALDLCDESLVDFIEDRPVTSSTNRKTILHDILTGLNFLHSEKIIHNDLKPQNILMKKLKHRHDNLKFRAVISDFGNSLIVDDGRQSQTVHEDKIGTEGWRAKEIIEAIEAKKKAEKDKSFKEKGSNETIEAIEKLKGSFAADMFAFGIIVHYVMSDRTQESNRHPFGLDHFRRLNIKNEKRWSYLLFSKNDENDINIRFDRLLADMLVHSCINGDPSLRPVTAELLKDDTEKLGHPLFWKPKDYIEFICNVSNYLRDSKNKQLATELQEKWSKWKRYHPQGYKWRMTEIKVFYSDDKVYYDNKLLKDYLRLVRNLKNHFDSDPKKNFDQLEDHHKQLQEVLGLGKPEQFHNYFNCRRGLVDAFPITYLQFYEGKIEKFEGYFPDRQYLKKEKSNIYCDLFDSLFIERERDKSKTRHPSTEQKRVKS